MVRIAPLLALVSLLATLALPAPAAAETDRLRLPTMAASIAAGAAWASTYHALTFYNVREVNPLLRPFESSPGRLVTVGAAMDGAAFTAWNLTVGRKHPKIAAAGLWTMAAFRGYLAIHNLRNERRAARREP